ncbi:PDC sensor domain-containing protein [Pseudoponticoccus marisrubri]|uniref:Uncharacterized protein n=1 Tax=Pseudoponticoccus marisrubri TaxID=1685382 RepID=A0A0W7WLU3_9RHOB|nr:PDC sensor domain-containing protein [Pseudoponticoccus marisrubri]KUF11561.1 hypothetical protein AVJ23_07320 [Pseudoponticoccus marisrubri]
MKRPILLAVLACLAAPAAHAMELRAAAQSYLDSAIRPWMQEPVLIEAIQAQNAVTSGYDQARVDSLDQAWRAEVGMASTPTIDAVLMNAASDFLRAQVAAAGGTVTEVFVMDAQGLNVAASGVTSDYWQGDEAKFSETYPKGSDAIHVSEVEFDESSQSYQAQISVSITDPATGDVIGAMTVGIDAEALM